MPVILETGEKLRTVFASHDISYIETCRKLLPFREYNTEIDEFLKDFEKKLAGACYAGNCSIGECAHASIALLRYAAAGGFGKDSLIHINIQLKKLKKYRNNKGLWRKYPRKYTEFVIEEIDGAVDKI